MDINDYNRNLKEKEYTKYQFLLAAYFILKPFYFFPSGMPQISDLIVMIMMYTVFVSENIRIHSGNQSLITWNILFVVYVFIVNGCWAVYLGGEAEFLLYSLYYLFNFFVVLLTLHLYDLLKTGLLQILFTSILFSTTVQLLMLLGSNFSGIRQTLFFNNPNQLGYFGLLCMALTVIIYYRVRKSIVMTFCTMIGSFILVLTSLSKAAIVSAGLMLFFFIIYELKSHKRTRMAIVIVFVILTVVFVLFQGNIEIDNHLTILKAVQERIYHIGSDGDDTLSGRGYDRIINHPQYLILGAGEGITKRFNSRIAGEIHSLPGNILFSYGFLGFFIFTFMILQCIMGRKVQYLYPLICTLLYNLTHNGVRQPMFWILMTLIFTTATSESMSS